VYKCHNFLNSFISNGALWLAIVNSAAINMGVQVPLEQLSRIPLGISLGVLLLDHMADLCLVF
jgi:hypothetical protein